MLKQWFSGGLRRQIGRIEVAGVIDSKTRERVLKALKEVEEKQIPAVVLRIDSPGGTVADSVASFGNIAASGGVYIAMGAEKIVSNPGTITGSIGVIIRGNNLEKLLDKIGISFKVIKSGPYKDILSFDRELTPEERNILQELIDITYSQFVHTIAAARRLSVSVVKTFADGRIFSGEQALHLGVVDRLGTEEDARLWAAELAGLPPEAKFYDLLPRRRGWARFLPVAEALERLHFEVSTSGLPLWLYTGP
jgi:protease-4